MNNLALAYVTCDKYSHVWDEWYDAFIEHWDNWNITKYFCGEEKECPFDDFRQIWHKPVEAEHWTSKLRAQIERIEEDNIFVWLDDMPQQFNISNQFGLLYDWFMESNADALRIMGRGSAASYSIAGRAWGGDIYRLTKRSRYRVSFSPNIYKKDFLLEVLSEDESPWSCELRSTGLHQERKVYAYHIDGWYKNLVVQ